MLRNHTSGYLRQPAGNQDAGHIIRLMEPYHGMQSKTCEFVEQPSREILALDLDQRGLKSRLVTSESPDDA